VVLLASVHAPLEPPPPPSPPEPPSGTSSVPYGRATTATLAAGSEGLVRQALLAELAGHSKLHTTPRYVHATGCGPHGCDLAASG
jgi:hypothetical protein